MDYKDTGFTREFQFQYGSIKRKKKNNWYLFLINFNSNMVRLKVAAVNNCVATVADFNSNMVRLKDL